MESMFQNLPGTDSDARLREASFSSYLEANVERFPRKLAVDAYDEDGEIGVFEAEKYFNNSIDGSSPARSMELQKQQEPNSSPLRMFGMTQSTGSQQSRNSRALLLQRSQTRKVSGVRSSRGILSSIICCSCGCGWDGDDSGDVGFWNGRDGFGPGDQWPPDFVLEKKLTMLPWSDVVPRKEDQNGPDSCSDATLDLFEIESLSGKASRLLLWHDAASVGAYAPSEASVEWSVATESTAATEFSFDDRSELTGKISSSLEWRSAKGSNRWNRNKSRKEIPRNRILLHC